MLVYLLYRRYPNSWIRYINVPIFFNAAGNIPPANTSKYQRYSGNLENIADPIAQYSLWFIVGFIFNYLIRKRAFDWWKRYNCEFPVALTVSIEVLICSFLDLLQAAMDTGTAIATIIIFFALGYHAVKFNWWGNTVGSNTYDAKSVPWFTVPEGGHFGKGPGQF